LPLVEGDASAFDLSVIYRAAEESQLLEAFLESVRTALAGDRAD